MKKSVRSGECGVRSRRALIHSALRTPHSALAVLFLACTPVTTRPRFEPFPEAQVLVVRGNPQRVTAEVNTWFGAERVPVAFMSPIDGYIETDWHQGAKLRAWANPAAPGSTRIIVEAVIRPFEDPSRQERDLERPAPVDHAGHRLAEQLLTTLRERFGSPP